MNQPPIKSFTCEPPWVRGRAVTSPPPSREIDQGRLATDFGAIDQGRLATDFGRIDQGRLATEFEVAKPKYILAAKPKYIQWP